MGHREVSLQKISRLYRKWHNDYDKIDIPLQFSNFQFLFKIKLIVGLLKISKISFEQSKQKQKL